jgi:MFS family permease
VSAPASLQPSPGWGGRLGLTRGAMAAIATVVAVGVAVSLITPLVSLTLAGRGFSERTIGAIVSTYAIAMRVTAPSTARVAARFGTANTIVALSLAAALLIPLFWLLDSIVWLFLVIFVYGGCVSLCFTLSEFWIATHTPEGRRGFVVGFYATLLSIGFAIGPGIIALLGARSVVPFLIGSVLMILAAIPSFAARRDSPDFHAPPKTRFTSFLFAAPVATIGAFVFAMGESSGFAFLPLWGRHLGFEAGIAVLLASAMTLGNVAFQIPLGILADRIDRRLIMLACGVAGALGMLLAWALAGTLPALVAVLFVWGGVTAGIYTVGLAHLAARFSGADLASANAAFVFCYALGMLVGPLAVGDAMARAPLFGFPLVLGAAFAVYSAVVGFRMARR